MSVIERVEGLEARTRRLEARLAALEATRPVAPGGLRPGASGGRHAASRPAAAAGGAGRGPGAAHLLRAAGCASTARDPAAGLTPRASPAAPRDQPRGPARRAGARVGGWAVAARGAAVPARRSHLA